MADSFCNSLATLGFYHDFDPVFGLGYKSGQGIICRVGKVIRRQVCEESVIDKIDGLGQIRTPQPIKRPAKTDGSGSTSFAKHIDEDSESAATGGVMSSNAISGILGVQEVDDALAHASKGKARANDILDKLEDLRLQLLTGTVSRDKLMQLSQMVNARRSAVKDPRLAALLDDIDLRAQVELAKYVR